MGNWIKVKISDIGEVVGGATPSTKNEQFYNGDISWITPKDLSDFKGRFISHGERNITQQGLESCSTRLLPKNTILFSSRAPIGYVAIAKKNMCTNQGFKSVIPNEKIDYMFLYYLLKYNKDRIEAMGSGTTFKEVSGSTMRNIEVEIPRSITEQKKIANILDAIDSKIENNQEINSNLEQQILSIFTAQFKRLYNSSSSTFENIIKFSNGKKRPDEIGNIPVYGGNGILAYTKNFNSENCVIIGRVGAYCGNVFLSTGPCWVSDNAIQAKSKISDSQLFVYYALKGANLPNRHIGTGQPLMTQGILNAIPFEIPDTKAVFEFEQRCIPLQQMIEKNLAENKKLSSIRDILLPKLISHEIDVSSVNLGN